jgi:tetratricopeptide (TPR) repeat protein
MEVLFQYLQRLPSDILAQFEVTSGLMVLNVDLATFQTAAQNYNSQTATHEDIALFSTINHETYHYFQTLATGFQYAYAAEVWRLIVEAANAQQREREIQQLKKQEEEQALAAELRESARKELQSKDETEAAFFQAVLANLDESSASKAKLYTGLEALLQQAQKARSWEESARDDFSLLAAELPSVAKGFGQLWENIRAPGVSGLSAEHLIEGSAIVFQHLLTHGREGLETRLADAWDETGETYRKAFDMAQEICGARALDIILPATSLALRYARPPEAYVVFLKKLKACEPGKEISAARALASTPLQIEAAGEYMGTALDVRSKQHRSDDRYPVYDDVLDKLEKRAWGFDEIELLSNRGPALKINDFPFVMVVKEGIMRTDMDSTLLASRVVCASLVLRMAKLPRYRRVAEQRIVERLHPIIASLVDPKLAAEEYFQLGVEYLNEGDPDQAEIVLERALSIYRSERDVKGAGWALYNLGVAYGARNDRERAQEMYRSALQAGEEVEADELIAMSANNLGDLYMKVDRLHEAEALILRALAIADRLDDKASAALYCWNLGRIYFAWKQLDRAREVLVRAVDLYRAVGDQKMVQWIETGLAGIDDNPE